MSARLITIIVVVVLVAAGLLLTRPGGGEKETPGKLSPTLPGEQSSVEGEKETPGLAGEVSLTLPGEQRSVEPDMNPPDFFITTEGGDAVTLSELRGKPVFINFWNTWCPPCRDEMPDLDKLYREYGNEVEFIFINILAQEKSVQDVTEFLSGHGYSIPVYLDRQGEVARAYGIRGIPTTVVLNSSGEVVYNAAGQISYADAKSLITE